MTTIFKSSRTDIEDGSSTVEAIKRKLLKRKMDAARKLAARVHLQPDGTLLIRRFSKSQRMEHQILIATFFTLAITGLLQRYDQTMIALVIISLFGNIDTLRVIHHLAAVGLIAQSIYHVFNLLNMWIVNLEPGAMMPKLKDFKDLVGMIMYNLDRRPRRPEFDRYSIEEKIEYWALLWGTPLMIITGIMMWFPIQITAFLPGSSIPIARALHTWEALLATMAILTWHMYHTVIKEKNTSIFTGYMTEQEMEHEHPLEYRRIMAAYRFVNEHRTQAGQRQQKLPTVDAALSEHTLSKKSTKVAITSGQEAERV